MESISLQCPVTIKVKVTEKFRSKMLDKMNKQLDEVNLNLSKIDIQRKNSLKNTNRTIRSRWRQSYSVWKSTRQKV